jgi:hypothetical protein
VRTVCGPYSAPLSASRFSGAKADVTESRRRHNFGQRLWHTGGMFDRVSDTTRSGLTNLQRTQTQRKTSHVFASTVFWNATGCRTGGSSVSTAVLTSKR